MSLMLKVHCEVLIGEKLTEEECSELFAGQEDASGNINYEGV